MKRVLTKIIMIILISLCMFSLLHTTIYANSIGEIFGQAANFIDIGEGNEPMSEDKIKEMSDILYNMLLVIAIIVAVIVGIVVGIKLMTGSVEEKAKTKETIIAYVAGCVVVFGSFTIWKVIVTILQST